MKAKHLVLAALMVLTIAAVPVFAAGKDIIYASDSTTKTLDPHNTSDTYSGAIERAICQGLLGFDKNMNIIPLLAESYTYNDSATEFTFKLRKGITFQDGAPFNAKAVKVNIDRLMTGKYVRSSLMDPVKELKIIDDYTVKFLLKQPFGAFLNALAHPGALMLSPAALEKYGDDIGSHPVGTGPFMFQEWVSGSYVLIKKNPNYWRGTVKVDSIKFVPIPENGSRVAMLRAGQAQYIYPMPAELLKLVENDPNIDVIKQPSIIERYLIFNTKSKVLSDERVRQAINYALDKKAIINIAWGGAATEADSVFPAALPFFKKEGPWPYDLAKAKELMKAAGYPNGFKVVFLTPNASARLRATQMVQQQLQAIGITGEIQSMDVASFYDMLSKNKPDTVGDQAFIAFGGWSSSTGDADWATRPLLSTEAFPPNMSNYGFFEDKTVDNLIKAGLTSADPKVRGTAYAQMQDYIWSKAPWGYLFVDTLIAAKAKNIQGIYPMADGAFTVEEAEIVQ
ncbi:MAG: glutathione ABC transporter substrate-binding protein [Rectinema sp.]|jgi:glutathione transport system substrate-binding protein|uniref:Glutathione-binding protein GsiB n=1 Tax=uncultured spirochete TaxID=156406 RepID=A0A3P3XNW3_9SPIR|nr:putative peptide transporter subunit: periplasmic-binding component of ABC superfamily [uncultured spirochete]